MAVGEWKLGTTVLGIEACLHPLMDEQIIWKLGMIESHIMSIFNLVGGINNYNVTVGSFP